MKKFLSILLLAIITCFSLTACNNSSKPNKPTHLKKETTTEKLQGTWVSDSPTATVEFGDYIKFKGNKVEVEQSPSPDDDPDYKYFYKIKSFNFKDKKQEHIRFYTMPQNDPSFAPEASYIEGKITIKGNKLRFQQHEDSWYDFKKKQ